MEEQVKDEQGCKKKTRTIMKKDPVMPGYPHPGDPAAAPAATGGKEEVQYQAGDERRDECDHAADINKGIEGDASQKVHRMILWMYPDNKHDGDDTQPPHRNRRVSP